MNSPRCYAWLVLAGLLHACAPECPSQPRIYGGTPVAPGALPAVAALTVGAEPGALSCSAALIGPDLLLTAGHCLKDEAFDATVLSSVQLAQQLHVYFGSGVAGGRLPASAAVQRVAVHPLLRRHPLGYADYGLVFLQEPVATAPLHPVLTLADLRAALLNTAELVGYGEREDRGYGLKFSTTAAVHAANSSEVAIGGGGHDACRGDSGGPALLAASTALPPLLGSVSRGLAISCGEGGLVSLAAAGWCWIQEVAASHLAPGPGVDCSSYTAPPHQPPVDFLALCGNTAAQTPTQRETIAALLLGLSARSCADAARRLAGPDLNLDYLMLRDLTPLSGLNGVRSLSLRGNRLSDLSPLAGLHGLKTLAVEGNAIASFASLDPLVQEGLYIYGKRRQEVHYTDTAFLRLCLDPATNASARMTIKAVAYTTMSSDCTVANERLLSLTRLNLSSRQLRDLSPLADLEQLRSLDLSGNPELQDVAPLAGLERLQMLDLSHTAAADLRPLAELRARGLQVIEGPTGSGR